MSIEDMKAARGVATVKLTLEVDLSQPWGGDCTLAQVVRQAKSGALGEVTALCHGSRGRIRMTGYEFVKVTATSPEK